MRELPESGLSLGAEAGLPTFRPSLGPGLSLGAEAGLSPYRPEVVSSLGPGLSLGPSVPCEGGQGGGALSPFDSPFRP